MKPKSVNILLNSATRLVKRGDYLEAKKIYSQILDLYPSNEIARSNLEKLNLKTTEYKEIPQSMLEEIFKLYGENRFSEALQKIRQIGSRYAPNHIVCNIRGLILSSQGDLIGALEAINTAIDVKPDYDEGHGAKGFILFKLGRYDEAEVALKKSLELNPRNSSTYNNYGVLLRESGRLVKAEESFREALKHDPLHVEACNNLGIVLQKRGKIKEAVNYYQKAVDINPKQVEAHVNLGNTLKELKLMDRAIKSFQNALAIDPEAEHVKHILSAMRGEKSLSAPRKYVSKVFDEYADNFEGHLIDGLSYKLPSLMKSMFDEFDKNEKCNIENAVDLGCGTGLCGEAFRDVAKRLWGVDLSSKMLLHAKKKGCYHKLIHGDISETLKSLDIKFDLFLSADTFIYSGDLQASFESVADTANDKAIFIFSTETLDKGDFKLLENGRFAHSRSYIENIAKKMNFTVTKYVHDSFRKEDDRWVDGGVYFIRTSMPD